MSSFSLDLAETAVARFTTGHFSELIKKDKGGGGVIYEAKHNLHGKVVVKVFASPDKYSEQEVKILVKVTFHQNIVRLLGSFFEDGTDAIRIGYVMEFMANGSLSAVIHDLSIEYNDNQVYSWIQQAGRGIAFLHSQNIIHRDVNTRNMLLGETIDVLKISDFGSAKLDATTTEINSCFMGTIVYMAPEVIGGKGVNSAADVYSLGISTWEMFHRKKPFYEHDGLNRFEIGFMIITGTRPKIELGMKEEMKNLVLRSLDAHYKKRPKAIDFTTIADKLGSETNLSPNAPKVKASLVESKNSLIISVNNARQSFAEIRTPPNRPLSSEIQNSFDSKLTLLIGGYRGIKTILAFEHNKKTWKELDVILPDFLSGVVVLDEELYTFAGEMDAGLFKLYPKNKSWIELTHIPNGRMPKFFQSVAYRSKLYVTVREYICDTVFAYDPATNSWSKLAITVFNNKLYIFGKSEKNSCMEAGYYDTVKDEWAYLSLDFAVNSLYTRVVTYKNELVFFNNPDVFVANFAEIPSLKKLPRLKSWRDSAAVFTCENSLLVAGGHKGGGSFSDAVESFDGMTWTELPRMPYGLTAFTTVTANGDLAKQLLTWSC